MLISFYANCWAQKRAVALLFGQLNFTIYLYDFCVICDVASFDRTSKQRYVIECVCAWKTRDKKHKTMTNEWIDYSENTSLLLRTPSSFNSKGPSVKNVLTSNQNASLISMNQQFNTKMGIKSFQNLNNNSITINQYNLMNKFQKPSRGMCNYLFSVLCYVSIWISFWLFAAVFRLPCVARSLRRFIS